MIADWSKALLIATPPKCGSTALHDALSKIGCMVVIGNSPHDGGKLFADWHTNEVATNLSFMRRALLVRNPADRLRSLWHWDILHNEKHGLLYRDDVEFVRHVVGGSDPFQLPVAVRFTNFRDAEIWRLENLQFHLTRNNYNVRLRRKNQSRFRGRELSPEALEIAADWIRIDADAFGY